MGRRRSAGERARGRSYAARYWAKRRRPGRPYQRTRGRDARPDPDEIEIHARPVVPRPIDWRDCIMPLGDYAGSRMEAIPLGWIGWLVAQDWYGRLPIGVRAAVSQRIDHASHRVAVDRMDQDHDAARQYDRVRDARICQCRVCRSERSRPPPSADRF